jgi:hypothetical protein
VTSRDTLRALISVSRSKPVERELCCPMCHQAVTLRGGRYVCVSWMSTIGCGGTAFDSLAELAVREERSDG